MLVEFERKSAMIHKDRLQMPQVMFLGAHTDDDAMFRLTGKLAQKGIGVTIATLTNSDARDLPNYEPDQLAKARWEEQLVAGNIGGIAQARRLESPDGRLQYYQAEGIAFAGELIDEIKPIALVTLSPEDPHSDHATAFAIANAVSGHKTPLYSTDTISGFGVRGNALLPDLYIPLTEEIEEIERQTYLANSSQVTDLPPSEQVDVDNVLFMTERRGREKRIPKAAVLFETGNTKVSPLRELFRSELAA